MSDDLHKRLERYLTTPLLPAVDEHAGDKRTRKRVAHVSPPAGSAQRVALEVAVPGYAVRVPEQGHAYKVITPLREGSDSVRLNADFAAAFSTSDTPAQQRLHARCGATALAEELLLFDLETTGLGNTPLFLIGALSWEQDELVIRQFLARDYGEEAAVIQLFLTLAAEKRFFITFNGASFDLPMLYQRTTAHDIPSVWHAHHFDLLHECRRVWRNELPNCQLQTLEQQICGHPLREDDIPGESIPAVYQAFARNGNAVQMAQIMRHNRQDLVTMADLLTKLPALGTTDYTDCTD